MPTFRRDDRVYSDSRKTLANVRRLRRIGAFRQIGPARENTNSMIVEFQKACEV